MGCNFLSNQSPNYLLSNRFFRIPSVKLLTNTIMSYPIKRRYVSLIDPKLYLYINMAL
jgi:hypothetical protein